MKKLHNITRIAIIFLAVFHFQYNSHAENVDYMTAKKVAVNLYVERAEIPVTNVSIAAVTEISENGETVFYVITYSSTGFALISDR